MNQETARDKLKAQMKKELEELTQRSQIALAIADSLESVTNQFEDAALRRKCRDTANELLTYLSTTSFVLTSVPTPGRLESTQQTSDEQSSGGAPTAPASRNHTPAPLPTTPSSRLTWAETVSSVAAPTYSSTQEPARRTGGPNKTYTPKDRKDCEDLRLLLTLDKDDKGASAGPPRMEAYTVRTLIIKELGLAPNLIPDAQVTRTGYAIRAADAATRDLLLAEGNKNKILQICGGADLRAPEKWYRYAVKEVPYSFQGVGGCPIDARTLIEEEVVTQTKVTPCDISESRHGVDPITRRGTFIVSFLQPVRPFRLFSASAQSQLISKKPRLNLHDPGCQGYCRGSSCKRVHRCNRCGDRLDTHAPGECLAPIKCANCCGPFRAGHEDCPAKPTQHNGRWTAPSKKTRAAIRLNGHRLYEMAHPTSDTGADAPIPTPSTAADKRARSSTETTGPVSTGTPSDIADLTTVTADLTIVAPTAATVPTAASETTTARPRTRRTPTGLGPIINRPISKKVVRSTRARQAKSGTIEYSDANRFTALLGDNNPNGNTEDQAPVADTDMVDLTDTNINVLNNE